MAKKMPAKDYIENKSRIIDMVNFRESKKSHTCPTYEDSILQQKDQNVRIKQRRELLLKMKKECAKHGDIDNVPYLVPKIVHSNRIG